MNITITSMIEPSRVDDLVDFFNEFVAFGVMDQEYLQKCITNHTVIVAFDQDTVMGGAILYHEHNSFENDLFEVCNLAVREDYRSKGIGTLLVTELLKYVPSSATVIAYAWDTPDGCASKSILESAGFSFMISDYDYFQEVCNSMDFACPHNRRGICSCTANKMIKKT